MKFKCPKWRRSSPSRCDAYNQHYTQFICLSKAQHQKKNCKDISLGFNLAVLVYESFRQTAAAANVIECKQLQWPCFVPFCSSDTTLCIHITNALQTYCTTVHHQQVTYQCEQDNSRHIYMQLSIIFLVCLTQGVAECFGGGPGAEI